MTTNFKGLIPIVLLAILVSCKTSIEIISPPTELYVTVYDTSITPVAKVKVALFEDYASYTTNGSNFRTQGAVAVDSTDAEGFVRFVVDPDKKYWIASFIEEKSSMQGLPIFHDNGISGYEVLRNFNKSAITKTSLVLNPAESYVTFYASNTLNNVLPIQFSIGARLDTIKQSISTAPVINDSKVRTIRIKRGSYPLSIINDLDCTSQEILSLKGGENLSINTNTCNSGKVSFWTVSPNRDILPIKVYLNQDKSYVGEIKESLSAEPKNCKQAGQLSLSLAPGDYTYLATVTGFSWEGRFKVAENDCQSIKLITRF